MKNWNVTEEVNQKTVFTIGHSIHTAEHFLALLKSFDISVLADVRNFPGSKRFPQYNKEALDAMLANNGIRYVHFKDLGGRRMPATDSVNTRWRNSAFRGYADYMSTESFATAVATLQHIALQETTAYMCAEAVWWSCHRALISDFLKIGGWKVMHIMTVEKADEHPFTSAARVVDSQLRYDDPQLF